jgi:plasmid rolling circle replication initiator protein Rep
LTNKKNGCIVYVADIKQYTPNLKELNPLQAYNTITECSCQYPPQSAEMLIDEKAGTPWRERKIMNEMLSFAFSAFDARKAERLASCTTFLQFRVFDDGSKKLHSMNSCHVRLCPICSWRRSLKSYANVMRVADYLVKEKNRQFVLLTLTVRNCDAHNLSKTIDLLFQGFNRFNQLKAFKQAFTGFYRALEVTRNCDKTSAWCGTYHPHLHVLLPVKKSYFTSRYYLSEETINKMWQRSCRLDYLPDIDIEKVKNDLKKGCAEIAKYSVKSKDIIIPEDWDLTCEVAEVLDKALDGRRLISYGGECAEVKRKLKLDDEESGDLVHIDEDAPTEEDYKIVNYFWFSGVRDYYGF